SAQRHSLVMVYVQPVLKNITQPSSYHETIRKPMVTFCRQQSRAGLVLFTMWCLVNLWGCVHTVVAPEPQEHSAIVYAQRLLKEMSKGLEKLRVPLETTVQEKGTYRLLAAAFFPHDVTMAQLMENFTRFCTHIGGTMVQSACQANADDAKQVHFLVRIEN